jgi:aspartyl-tRNA synthetase
MNFRSHNCGELSLTNINEKITLCGWVFRIRNKNKIIWIDLRDRYGITQIVFEKERCEKEVFDIANEISREFLIKIEGTVSKRNIPNKNIQTGDIEILVEKVEIINESKNLPFTLEDESDGGEELRMKYRYLDLRRRKLFENIKFKHDIIRYTRNFLEEKGFIDIETPILVKSTPGGARDFLVPSRNFESSFYALPQSPQIFKQLLMISGFDRYYQIVKCFRDEDFRSDRQPEFTQIDCEMSFVDQEDVLNIFEELIQKIFLKFKNIKLNKLERITYQNAMSFYGSDKPDLRYDLKFVDITDISKKSNFKDFFESEIVVGFNAKNCFNFSKKEIEDLEKILENNFKIFYIKKNENIFTSSISKFFSDEDFKNLSNKFNLENQDLAIIICGKKDNTLESLGRLRTEIAKRKNLISKDEFSIFWVVDFPLFEYNERENKISSKHHPFTMIKEEDIDTLEKNLIQTRAKAYDLVINGSEIGGGSVRIHSSEIQKKIFDKLGFDDEQIKNNFGFFIEALNYGTPPHAGIAFGLDRLCTVIQGDDSIKNFIAFPKNNSGKDTMMNAPSKVLIEN